MHCCRYGFLRTVSCIIFQRDVSFEIEVKEIYFDLIWPQHFFPLELRILMWPFLRSSFLLAALSYKPEFWSTFDIVVTCRQWPLCAIKSFNSFNVSIVPSTLSDQFPPHYTIRRYSLMQIGSREYQNNFCFLIMDLIVNLRIDKTFEIFLYPSHDLCFSTNLSLQSFQSI